MSTVFYRTVLRIEVLSDQPFEWEDLSDVGYCISQGDCVGKVEEERADKLTGKEMADALYAAGSEPSFFMLDDDGNEEGA